MRQKGITLDLFLWRSNGLPTLLCSIRGGMNLLDLMIVLNLAVILVRGVQKLGWLHFCHMFKGKRVTMKWKWGMYSSITKLPRRILISLDNLYLILLSSNDWLGQEVGILLERRLCQSSLPPEVWGQESVRLGEGVEGGLDKVSESLCGSTGACVAIFNTGHL